MSTPQLTRSAAQPYGIRFEAVYHIASGLPNKNVVTAKSALTGRRSHKMREPKNGTTPHPRMRFKSDELLSI